MTYLYDKIELTKNNHIKYFYNNDPMSLWRTHEYDLCNMTFGGQTYNVEFVDALIKTAKDFNAKCTKPLKIFLSGGLDSEVACRAFSLAQVPYTPVIVRFPGNLNAEDVSQAIDLCLILDKEPQIIDINPIKFFESGDWQRICVDYQSYTFYQQLLLHVAEKVAEPMLTVDEIELIKTDDKTWAFIKKEDQDGCWHRFIDKTGIPAYNNFYTYDPSTMLSFFKSPTVKKLIRNEIFGKLSWTSSKNQIYEELTEWSMINRPKRTGMEKMMFIWTYVEEATSKLLVGNPKIFEFNVDYIQDNLLKGNKVICNIT